MLAVADGVHVTVPRHPAIAVTAAVKPEAIPATSFPSLVAEDDVFAYGVVTDVVPVAAQNGVAIPFVFPDAP